MVPLSRTLSILELWVQRQFGTFLKETGSYDLEKENGTLVASRTIRNVYPKVIGPGEKVICFDAGRLDGVDITEETSLIPRVEVDRARVENIKFPVTDIQLSAGVYGGIKALGRVENTTDELYEDIRVAVFLYDTNDMPIGLLRASLPSRLAPGEKVGFEANEFSSQGSIGIELVARFEAVAYPMQYNW